MSDIPIKENLTNDDIREDEEIPLEKPVIGKQTIKKERKPKTPAQLEQFEKVRLKRLDKLKEKKELEKIEASKLLLNNGYVKKEELPPKKTIEPIKQILTPHTDDKTDNESDNDDENVIIVKKKKKPKKKTIIIEESDESEEEPQVVYKKTRDLISQQNKKSVLKIHRPQVHDYFV